MDTAHKHNNVLKHIPNHAFLVERFTELFLTTKAASNTTSGPRRNVRWNFQGEAVKCQPHKEILS
jgi:hypothetical protein